MQCSAGCSEAGLWKPPLAPWQAGSPFKRDIGGPDSGYPTLQMALPCWTAA